MFFVDSQTTLELLSQIEGEEGEVIKWEFAIRSMDELLDNFSYRLEEKLLLLKNIKDAFIHEHGGSKELKLQLDAKFRNFRSQTENALNREMDSSSDVYPLLQLLSWKKDKISPIVDKIIELNNSKVLQIHLDDLMASYMHMMLNRIFKSKQRTYEMVLYDILYRYYNSKIAREKSIKKVLLEK